MSSVNLSQQTWRKQVILLAAAIGLLLSVMIDISLGAAKLSLGEVLRTLVFPEAATPEQYTIVWSLRTPVALLAVLVGATLGVAGATMQTLLNNPLASPYTLGVSSAASFGAASAIVWGSKLSPVTTATLIPLSAFAFALGSSALILWIGHIKGGSAESIVLCGIAILFLFHSGVAALQYWASEDTLQAIVFWQYGSVQSASWLRIALISVVLLMSLPILFWKSWQLTALRLGEDHARSLGVAVPKLRIAMLLIVSALTAMAVCFSGAIGFIGLVSPHIARLAAGEDHRFFLPLSLFTGGILLSLASTASKTLLPGAILPLGIVTSLIGVPFFFVMVIAQKRNYW